MDQCIPLPASCNWGCIDVASAQRGIVAFGAKDVVQFVKTRAGGVHVDDHVFSTSQRVSCVSFLKGSPILTVGCDDGKLYFYSVSGKTVLHTVALQHPPKTLDSTEGTVACGDFSGQVSLFSVHECDVSQGAAFTPLHGVLTVLRFCSEESIMALGYLSGRVSLVSTHGAVLCSVTLHSEAVQCLAWCAVVGDQDRLLLASAAKDQKIVVWSAPKDGSSLTRLKQLLIPNKWLPNRQSQNYEQRFIPLCCVSTHLIAGISSSGNVVSYNLAVLLEHAADPAKCQELKVMFNLVAKAGGQTVFYSIAHTEGNIALFSRDRIIRAAAVSETDNNGMKQLSATSQGKQFCLGGPGFCMASNKSSFVFAGCGDGSLAVIPPPSSHLNIEVLPGPNRITAIACHPKQLAAFVGHSDGSITLREKRERKWTMQVFKTPHKVSVYTLLWCTGVWSGPGAAMFSLSGGGMIFEHCVATPTRPPINVTTKMWHLKRAVLADLPDVVASIGKSLNSSVCVGNHAALEGQKGADGKFIHPPRLFIVGSKDGIVDVWLVKAPVLKTTGSVQPSLAHTFKYHSDQVNNIDLREGTCVVAICGNDGCVKVLDVSSLLEEPSLRQITSSALVCEGKHHKPVMNVKWSPGDATLLASASYDRTAQIWKVVEGTLVPLTSYRNHTARIFSQAWVVPDLGDLSKGHFLYTCSGDNTIRRNSYHSPEVEHYTAPPLIEATPESNKRKKDADEGGQEAKRPKHDSVAGARAWFNSLKDVDRKTPSDISVKIDRSTLHAVKLLSESIINKETQLGLDGLAPDASPLDLAASLITKNDAHGLAMLPLFGKQQWKSMLNTVASARTGMPVYSACCLVAVDRAGDACKLLAECGMTAEAALVAYSHAKDCTPSQMQQLLGCIYDKQSTEHQQSLSKTIMGKIMSSDYETALHLLNQDPSVGNLQLSCFLAELRCKDEDSSQKIAYLNEVRDKYAASALQHDITATPLFHGVGCKVPHPLALAAVAVEYYFGDSSVPLADKVSERRFTPLLLRHAVRYLWKNRTYYSGKRSPTSLQLNTATVKEIPGATAIQLAILAALSVMKEQGIQIDVSLAALRVAAICPSGLLSLLKGHMADLEYPVNVSEPLAEFIKKLISFLESEEAPEGGIPTAGACVEEVTSLLGQELRAL